MPFRNLNVCFPIFATAAPSTKVSIFLILVGWPATKAATRLFPPEGSTKNISVSGAISLKRRRADEDKPPPPTGTTKISGAPPN